MIEIQAYFRFNFNIKISDSSIKSARASASVLLQLISSLDIFINVDEDPHYSKNLSCFDINLPDSP